MYLHKNQLRHLLAPQAYFSPEQYRREMGRLFLPGWHAVAVRSDMPRDGDFLTFELFGRPLVLWNIEGKVRAFLNVCAHRHCTLTGAARGSSERLRCQYHGWEYRPDGRTAKIPDAGCFRPFDRDSARLHPFRAETAGELVFVSLADDPPPLREYLGPFYDFCVESFAPPFRFAWRWDAHYPANWKPPVENSLEAYHVACVHPKSFGTAPPEETTEHTLEPGYSILRTPEPPGLVQGIQNWLVRRLGAKPENFYVHRLLHPNLIFISMDIFRMVQVFLPTSPTTSRHLIYLFTLRGRRGGPFAHLVYRLLRLLTVWITRKIVREDQTVFAPLQRGLEASPYPGVLGTVEERVYVFQDFIRRTCGDGQDGTNHRGTEDTEIKTIEKGENDS